MAIIIDLKNAIRDNIHGIDADINCYGYNNRFKKCNKR